MTLAAPAQAAVAPSAEVYVGRWNVRITDATDTFESSGFDIARKDGALQVSLVWRWGSFLEAKSAEVRDGVLHVVREEKPGQLDRFELRLAGERLEVKVTYPDGKIHHFEGRRAPLLLDRRAPVWGEPVSLFDGKTLDGWRLRDPKKKNGWAVVNGELAVVDPKDNADFVTERAFQDMKLHVEFNVEPHSNSGVYLRGRYEIQIESGDPNAGTKAQKCGALYSRVAPRATAHGRAQRGRGRKHGDRGHHRRRAQPLRGRARPAHAAGRSRQGALPQHRADPGRALREEPNTKPRSWREEP
jgi:hypothetical protein